MLGVVFAEDHDNLAHRDCPFVLIDAGGDHHRQKIGSVQHEQTRGLTENGAPGLEAGECGLVTLEEFPCQMVLLPQRFEDFAVFFFPFLFEIRACPA